MAGGGRPTDYKQGYAEQAYKLCLLGSTDKQLADFFDVSEQTINAWKQKHPEFLESLKAGKEIADAKVGESLFQRATGYQCPEDRIFYNNGEVTVVPTTKHYPPDPTSMIFWLKNRQRDKWNDRKEHTGPGGKPLIPEEQTDLETVRRAAFVIAKALHQQDDDCDH